VTTTSYGDCQSKSGVPRRSLEQDRACAISRLQGRRICLIHIPELSPLLIKTDVRICLVTVVMGYPRWIGSRHLRLQENSDLVTLRITAASYVHAAIDVPASCSSRESFSYMILTGRCLLFAQNMTIINADPAVCTIATLPV
jgi:hypothetical protein